MVGLSESTGAETEGDFLMPFRWALDIDLLPVYSCRIIISRIAGGSHHWREEDIFFHFNETSF